MKPLDRKPGRARGARQKVARRIERRLGLLRGFPTGPVDDAGRLPWRLVPRAGVPLGALDTYVTRDDLARIGVTLRGLTIRFPDALPAVVGDAAAFTAAVEARLAVLEKLLAASPESTDLAPLLEVSSFRTPELRRLRKLLTDPRRRQWGELIAWELTDPETRAASLRIAEEFGLALDELAGFDAAAALWAFALCRTDGIEAVQPAVAFLASARSLAPLRDPVRQIGTPKTGLAQGSPERRQDDWMQILRATGAAPRPRLLELLQVWAALDRDRRKPFGVLLTLLLPEELAERAVRRLRRFEQLARAASFLPKPKGKDVRSALVRADRLLPRFPVDAVFQALARLAADGTAREMEQLAQTLAAFPSASHRRSWRADFLLSRQAELDRGDRALHESLEEHVRACRDDPEALLAPWSEAMWDSCCHFVRWNPVASPSAILARFRTARAGELPTPGRGWTGDKDSFWQALSATDDVDLLPALDRGRRSLTEQGTVYWHQFRGAVRMAAGDPQRLVRLLEQLPSWTDDEWIGASREPMPLATDLGTAWLDEDHAWCRAIRLIFEPLEDCRAGSPLEQTLLQVGREVAGLADPEPVARHALLERLPESLRETGARVLAESDGATALAREIERLRPSDATMNREIDALQGRIPAIDPGPRRDGMQRRLDNLRARREAPWPRTLVDRLRRRLDSWCRRARRSRQLTSARERLRAARQARFAGLPLEALDARAAADPRIDRLLHSLLELDKPWPALGSPLLTHPERCPPAGLVEHPANQRFLEGATGRGLDLTRWLAAEDPTSLGEAAPELSIHLAHDPIDVLHMGTPFGTCLSPGDINFHSAVANALDADKRVVLVRRGPERQVVGRCLLALTTDYRLLTFRAYGKVPGVDLREHVAAFVRRLAEDLGTEVVSRGKVLPRVGPDWYDDGPVDLTQRLTWTAHDHPLWSELGETPPEQILTVLERHAGDLASLRAPQWDAVVEQHLFEGRSALLMPLAPHVLAQGSRSACAHLAWHAHRCDRREISRAAVRRAKSAVANLDRWPRDRWYEAAVHHDPAVALRALRRARPGRRHELEERVHWMQWVGIAHRQLGRRRKAERWWRDALRAMERADQPWWQRVTRRTLEELMAALRSERIQDRP